VGVWNSGKNFSKARHEVSKRRCNPFVAIINKFLVVIQIVAATNCAEAAFRVEDKWKEQQYNSQYVNPCRNGEDSSC